MFAIEHASLFVRLTRLLSRHRYHHEPTRIAVAWWSKLLKLSEYYVVYQTDNPSSALQKDGPDQNSALGGIQF